MTPFNGPDRSIRRCGSGESARLTAMPGLVMPDAAAIHIAVQTMPWPMPDTTRPGTMAAYGAPTKAAGASASVPTMPITKPAIRVLRVARHFVLTITDTTFTVRAQRPRHRRRSPLDGLYVIRTSVPQQHMGRARLRASLSTAKVRDQLGRNFGLNEK